MLPRADVVVIGLIYRDLVLRLTRPEMSATSAVSERWETLGGAANQAVALAQLGRSAALVGVVGEDAAARLVLDQAAADGLEVDAVVRRPGTSTALVVDVVTDRGRLLEHLPQGTWLTEDDVRAARGLITSARSVTVEMRQPAAAVVEAVEQATASGAIVLVDGAAADSEVLTEVLPRGVIVRCDEDEASQMVGRTLDGVEDARAVARALVGAGARLAVLAAGDAGNVLAWAGGDTVLPLLGGSSVDATGGGDAFVAGLLDALLDGASPVAAGRWGSAAAALTVTRAGGRPALDRGALADLLREAGDCSASAQ